MNIDFHHTATYVIARMAGFPHGQANTVAYAAQYVDDATNSGVIRFKDGRMFSRFATAHKMIDPSNWVNADNVLTWMPFHFLPGNCNQPAGSTLTTTSEGRLACFRNSLLAQEMTAACIVDAVNGASHALHRLGITAHVYADTWAHHGFVGMVDRLNAATALRKTGGRRISALIEHLRHPWQAVSRLWRSVAVPGHLEALKCPDQPFLSWTYNNWNGDTVARKNSPEFLEAANALCSLFQRFLAPASGAPVSGLQPRQQDMLARMFEDAAFDDERRRHSAWLEALGTGAFGFPGVELAYVDKGEGSWKEQALLTTARHDDGTERFTYQPGFERTDWCLFHVAAKVHRAHVVEDLLPKYGIAL